MGLRTGGCLGAGGVQQARGCFYRNVWTCVPSPPRALGLWGFGALGFRGSGAGASAKLTGVHSCALPSSGQADGPRTDLPRDSVGDFLLHVPATRSVLLLSLVSDKAINDGDSDNIFTRFSQAVFVNPHSPVGSMVVTNPARDTETGLPEGEGMSEVTRPQRSLLNPTLSAATGICQSGLQLPTSRTVSACHQHFSEAVVGMETLGCSCL